MNAIWSDIKLGCRILRKTPLLTMAAILSLALGISANSVIFSVLDALVLHPLPFNEPSRIVVAWQNRVESPEDTDDVTPANFVDWSRQNRSLERMAAYEGATFNLTDEGAPEEASGMRITPGFFETLGISPLRGRLFSEEEASSTQSLLVIISYGLWQRRFGSDPLAVGKQIRLNGMPHTIVGVMRPGWFLSPDTDVWTPLGWAPGELKRDDHRLSVIGRLRAGVLLEQARTDMDALARQLAHMYPAENSGYGVLLKPVSDVYPDERDRRVLIILMAAVGVVLLIACANVANLQMAKVNARAKENAIRAALGAPRWRIVQQHLVASILLALAGGALGLVFCAAGIDALRASVALSGTWNKIDLDPPVVAFTFAVSVLSGIAFGVFPAMRRSDSLQQSDRTGTSTGAFRQFGRVLVAMEAMLAVALLSIGTDMVRTFLNLRSRPPGFDASHLITMRVSLPAAKFAQNQFSSSQTVTLTFDRIAEKLRSLPGVESLAYTTVLPRSDSDPKSRFVLPENRQKLGGDAPVASWRAVSAGYFHALRVPILEGREFTEDDRFGKEQVVVISAAAARRFFPGKSALGKQVFLFDAPRRVVGIAGDTLLNRTLEFRPCIYLSHSQSPRLTMHFLIRTAANPAGIMSHLAPLVWAVDPEQPVGDIMTFQDYADLQFAGRRLITNLLVSFCVVALVMAAVGVYGLISYLVGQRKKEIGIRIALGASKSRIFGNVMREACGVAAIGCVAGIILLLATRRALAGFWGGILETDWSIPIVAGAVVLVIAAAATLIPATRATGVPPNIALREY
jgi:putative ABC transport system permease protein